MKDFNTYNLNLSRSLEDKLFFLKKIDLESYDLIVDYGCATGDLLRKIECLYHDKKPDIQYIGYDINEEMINVARDNTITKNILFTDEWEMVELKLNSSFPFVLRKSLIIFSSVLHEVGHDKQLEIMQNIMPMFDTVVIRDMKRPLNNEPISNITRKRCLKQVAPWQAEMFEKKWGKIKDKENLYRFFLMNEFVNNFEKEVEEDYFSVLWSEIEWILKDHGFKTQYVQSFILPYRRKQVKKRFNHTMHDITHRKAIYVKGAINDN